MLYQRNCRYVVPTAQYALDRGKRIAPRVPGCLEWFTILFRLIRAARKGLLDMAGSENFAQLGRSVFIRGELSGSEDIYVDGQVEGTIQLSGNSLTIGPNGRIRANITAKNVTVSGSVNGNIEAGERTEMRKSAVVNGDVKTRRIAIEEGAFFTGKLEILGDSKPQAGPGAVAAAASATPSHTKPHVSDPGK
jgi:cytoskeletal protein CcmA (bactofilin family)